MSKNRIIPTVWVAGAMLLSLPAIASAASVIMLIFTIIIAQLVVKRAFVSPRS